MAITLGIVFPYVKGFIFFNKITRQKEYMNPPGGCQTERLLCKMSQESVEEFQPALVLQNKGILPLQLAV